MSKIVSFALVLLLALPSWGQNSDTLKCGYDHSFANTQVIAPATLFYTGATIALTPRYHQSIDYAVRDWFQQDGHARMRYDDGIQFLPLVSVFALKACGVKSQHDWPSVTSLSLGSSVILAALTISTKNIIQQQRPYGAVYTSFPSGHTGTAFMGAEILRREYGKEYPGIAIAGYAVATSVGIMRMYNNRHWASDVLAGAGVGILSASIMYWLAPYLTF